MKIVYSEYSSTLNEFFNKKDSNGSIRAICETYSKLSIKALELNNWHHYSVFMANFIIQSQHIIQLFLVVLLLNALSKINK